MARGDEALQTGGARHAGEAAQAGPDAGRRRRVRNLTIKLALFAVAVYVVFIIVFVRTYG